MAYSDRLDDMVNAIEGLLGATLAASTNVVTEKDYSNVTTVPFGETETAVILIRFGQQGHPKADITYMERYFFIDILTTSIEVLESIENQIEEQQHYYSPPNTGDPTHLGVQYIGGQYYPQHFAMYRVIARWQF